LGVRLDAVKLFEQLIGLYERDYATVKRTKPATEASLRKLEKKSGLLIPADLRQLLLQYNGLPFVPLFPNGSWLCSVSKMLETWTSFAQLADEFNAEVPPQLVEGKTHLDAVYHRERLPIIDREDFHLCLDFAPGPKGTSGQVLMLVNECDFVVVGSSFSDFLSRWISIVQAHSEAGMNTDPPYWLPKKSELDWGQWFLKEQSK
jgi:cell wall assembly regulator SMI1